MHSPIVGYGSRDIQMRLDRQQKEYEACKCKARVRYPNTKSRELYDCLRSSTATVAKVEDFIKNMAIVSHQMDAILLSKPDERPKEYKEIIRLLIKHKGYATEWAVGTMFKNGTATIEILKLIFEKAQATSMQLNMALLYDASEEMILYLLDHGAVPNDNILIKSSMPIKIKFRLWGEALEAFFRREISGYGEPTSAKVKEILAHDTYADH